MFFVCLFLKLQMHWNRSNKCKNSGKPQEAIETKWNLLSRAAYLTSFRFFLFLLKIGSLTLWSSLKCNDSPQLFHKISSKWCSIFYEPRVKEITQDSNLDNIKNLLFLCFFVLFCFLFRFVSFCFLHTACAVIFQTDRCLAMLMLSPKMLAWDFIHDFSEA